MRSVVLLLVAALFLLGGCGPAMHASLARARGDYQEALAGYNEALAKDPGSTHLRHEIGMTYFAMRDYASAERNFLGVLALRPGDPDAAFYLGLARIGKGEREAALDLLDTFSWPFKFYQQKFVREEAQRLRRHPETPPDEAIRGLISALEEGTVEQKRYENETFNRGGW